MPGLKAIPRSEFGSGFGVELTDLSSSFTLPPSKIGFSVTNKTGGTLTAGTLVYVNGRDATSGFSTIAKASASAEGTLASWVVIADILNNGNGTVAKAFVLTGQNTNAANVGDYVYLDTTAGGYTLTTPPGAALLYQRVGTVSVKSATVGMVVINLDDWPMPQVLERVNVAITVPTTGTTEFGPIQLPRAGTIIGLRLAFVVARALDGTNWVGFSANDRTTAKLLTNAVTANSTFTGGQAITQYAGYPLTVTATAGDLVAGAADAITLTAAVTGTLPAALPGTFSLIYVPN